MPDTAKIAQRGPYIVEAGPGTVYWCQCGRSKTQPFCDGSHTGTDFAPAWNPPERAEAPGILRMQTHEESAVLRRHPLHPV